MAEFSCCFLRSSLEATISFCVVVWWWESGFSECNKNRKADWIGKSAASDRKRFNIEITECFCWTLFCLFDDSISHKSQFNLPFKDYLAFAETSTIRCFHRFYDSETSRSANRTCIGTSSRRGECPAIWGWRKLEEVEFMWNSEEPLESPESFTTCIICSVWWQKNLHYHLVLSKYPRGFSFNGKISSPFPAHCIINAFQAKNTPNTRKVFISSLTGDIVQNLIKFRPGFLLPYARTQNTIQLRYCLNEKWWIFHFRFSGFFEHQPISSRVIYWWWCALKWVFFSALSRLVFLAFTSTSANYWLITLAIRFQIFRALSSRHFVSSHEWCLSPNTSAAIGELNEWIA